MSHGFERATPLPSIKHKPPSSSMQSSRIPTMPGAGQPSAATPRSHMTRTPSARSRHRRGSSTSDDEPFQRNLKATVRSQTRNMASNGGQPPMQHHPASTQSSLPRSVTPSGNREVFSNRPQNESGSSIPRFGKSPTAEGKPRNVLRRKAPSIEQYSKGARVQANNSIPVPELPVETTSKEPRQISDKSSMGGRIPPASSFYPRHEPSPGPAIQHTPRNTPKITEPQIPSVPKELRGLTTATNTRNIPHPAPPIPTASSPSTMYSDSPGPWSSRTSTPTSISSYSPGILQPTKIGSRLRQPSPSISGRPVQHRSPRHPSPFDSATSVTSTDALPISSSPQSRPTEATPARPQMSDTRLTESQMKLTSLARTPTEFETPPSTQNLRQNRSDDKQRKGSVPGTPRGQISGSQSSTNVSRLPTSAANTRPSRPSRKGTGDLHLESSPVIHSNLASSRLPEHKPQSSRSSPRPLPNQSTESLQSTSSSRVPRPSPSPNPSTRQPLENPKVLDQRPARRNSTLVKDTKEAEIPKEQATSDRSKRFGIFSKKSKTVPEVTPSRRGESQSRKGPAAGTGHEGYGRYVHRGRRSSVGSSTGRGRSTSTSASASQNSLTSRAPTEMDDFFRDRLEPIIINGGGSDGAELARTTSQQSVGSLSVASTTSLAPSTVPLHPGGYSSESLASYGGYMSQSPDSYDHHLTGGPSSKQQEGRKTPKRAVLVKRRSLLKPPASGGEKGSSQRHLPSAGVGGSRPSIDDTNTSVTSLSQSDVPIRENTAERQAEPEVKNKKSKWSFFQRSHHVQRKEPQPDLRAVAMPEVPVSVNKLPTPRQRPHYAVLDNEQFDSDSLEDILRRIEDSPPTGEEETEESPVGLGLKKVPHGPSVLLPEPPAGLINYGYDKPSSSPKVFFNKDLPTEDFHAKEAESQPPKPRANRLASVGRIPKVVSREDRQNHPHNPAAQSFSRPFSRGEEPSLTTTAAGNPTYLSPSSHYAPPQLDPAATDDDSHSHTAYQYPSSGQEFFTFPPRKGSDESGSGSSESRISLAPVTAVVPSPESELNDDEVWDEYDEFIDHVVSPPPTHAEPEASSPRKPFQKATKASKALQHGLNGADYGSIPTSPSTCSTATSILSTAMDNEKDSVHLRRSMVANALHSSLAPSTAMSFNEFYNGAGEGNRGSRKLATQESSTSLRTKKPLPVPSEEIERSSNIGASRKRNTVLLDLAERNRHGALSQANLRSGSLMTSRWLSFGRVLFSPAQNHVRSQDQSRILVIDGLGNDDWSFYCALTYPMATVYSLSVSQSPPRSNNPAAWDPPPNHRTVHHAHINNPFPFPKGFFTVAIIRFPAACSETELRATVSESKRVLRAGAYLELSVIDLDMVNMGSRARKAVRTLKEQMYTTDPSLSLKPASDNIQRLLGKRGFQNLNRCMVVVPVAGSIMTSSDTSSSGYSVKLGSLSSASGNPRAAKQRQKRPPSDDADVSLGELLADSSPSESNDESIAKTVARVGRWWYTRCYESCVLDGNLDNSMWTERRLLRECQRRGTGFKLLIAYAQKPSELPRRTVSV